MNIKIKDAAASLIYVEYYKKLDEFQSALDYIYRELKKKRVEMQDSEYVRDPFAFIEERIKSFDSVITKYPKRCNGESPENLADVEKYVRDIAGMRIICHYVDDVYTAEQIIRLIPNVQILEDERDDYIKHPKKSGYSSLHLTLLVNRTTVVEIQIRSMLMHSWSRLEHYLRYKNEEPKKSTIKALEYLAKMFRQIDKLLIILRDHGNEEEVISKTITDIEKVSDDLKE